MRSAFLVVVIAALLATAWAGDHLVDERFGQGWEQRWVIQGGADGSGLPYGTWDITPSLPHAFETMTGRMEVHVNSLSDADSLRHHHHEWEDPLGDSYGVRAATPAAPHAIARAFINPAPVSNDIEPLIVQMTVRTRDALECGGAHLSLYPAGMEARAFGTDAPWVVRFGPDLCGSSERRLVVEVAQDGALYVDRKTKLRGPLDSATHLYRCVFFPNGTFEVVVDHTRRERGQMSDAFRLRQTPWNKADNAVGAPPGRFVAGRAIDAAGGVGIALFHGSAGAVFDNILVTRNLTFAERRADLLLGRMHLERQSESGASPVGRRVREAEPAVSGSATDVLEFVTRQRKTSATFDEYTRMELMATAQMGIGVSGPSVAEILEHRVDRDGATRAETRRRAGGERSKDRLDGATPAPSMQVPALSSPPPAGSSSTVSGSGISDDLRKRLAAIASQRDAHVAAVRGDDSGKATTHSEL